jgi:putative intracellular protease/amidase
VQAVSGADADAYDGVIVIASPHGGARLALDEEARSFLTRMNAEGKPIGAISDGVLALMSAGLGDPQLSAPSHLLPTAEKAGVETSDAGMTVDTNIVSAAGAEGMERFLSNLKRLLAERRCATITPGNDISSAVGEGG